MQSKFQNPVENLLVGLQLFAKLHAIIYLVIGRFAFAVGLPVYLGEGPRFVNHCEVSIGLNFASYPDQYRVTIRAFVLAVDVMWAKAGYRLGLFSQDARSSARAERSRQAKAPTE